MVEMMTTQSIGREVLRVEANIREMAATYGINPLLDLSGLELVPDDASHGPMGHWSEFANFVEQWASDGRWWVNVVLVIDGTGRSRIVYEVQRNMVEEPLPAGILPAIMTMIQLPLPGSSERDEKQCTPSRSADH